MLGVIANPADECVVREFFELFKTPWEFYQPGRHYDVVLCDGDADLDDISAKLLLVYASAETRFDGKQRISVQSRHQGAELFFAGTTLPIHGHAVTFRPWGNLVASDKRSSESAAFVDCAGGRLYARIGYDLFQEIHTLLAKGQPSAHAASPTLDLHIAFLRDLITGCGFPVVEIPPVPDSYPFITCLTHDLDHASIRRHKFDSTIAGFLYRSTIGSILNWRRGRMPLKNVLANVSAAARLPFVYAGIAADFWSAFDRYLDLEKGRPSTFFVIPFADHSGEVATGLTTGAAPEKRACRYDISHIAGKIRRLRSHGCEIGLHGLDAWCKSERGRQEATRISEVSGDAEVGVRMHWLYRDERTPKVLEEAGFAYDSTVGYNETVGYLAGTNQVFKPLQAAHILELPLHVMDTAMFYPDYLDLSEDQAWQRLVPFFDHASRNGGVFTVNWHDRSISPERLWGDFYVRLLDELTARGVWFCTAKEAVSWFQKRRSAVFEKVDDESDALSIRVVAKAGNDLPGLRLRFHAPRNTYIGSRSPSSEPAYSDTSFNGRVHAHFSKTEFKILNSR